jgi:thiol-disulfide isomerase/thioredoxin
MKTKVWLIWGLVLAGCLNDARASTESRFKVGEKLESFALKAAYGAPKTGAFLSLRDYWKGGDIPKKAVLLSFFATYCGPCKKEMPFLAALQQVYGHKGLQILLITIDKAADKRAEAVRLAKENGVTFPVLSDRFNIVARRYSIEKLPCIYLSDSEGIVRFSEVGYSGNVTQTIHRQILTVLGEPLSGPVPEALAPFLTSAKGTVLPGEGFSEAQKAKSQALGTQEGDQSKAQPASGQEGEQSLATGDNKRKSQKKRRRKNRKKRKRYPQNK